MHIVQTKSGHKLMRYGGQQNGKNIEVRVGLVPLGTLASALDEELKLDLTPRELKQLVEFLNLQTAESIRNDCESLAKKVDEITTAVGAGIADVGSLERLKIAAKSFLQVVAPSLLAPVKSKRAAKPKLVPAAAVNAADPIA